MSNFNFSLKGALILALLIARSNNGVSQAAQITGHTVVNSGVVNVAELVKYEIQHPLQQRVRKHFISGLQQQYSMPVQNLQAAPANGVLRGSADSVPASPSPTQNFHGPLYDNNYSPACPDGAVNESYLVSTSEYNLVIQNRAGTITQQVDLYHFWAAAVPLASEWPSRVDYDKNAKRWIIGSFCDEATDTAGVLIGISQTEDPTGNWNLYKVKADSTGTEYPDFPIIGFNKQWIVINAAMFRLSDNSEDSDVLFLFDRSKMIDRSVTGCSSLKIFGDRISLAATEDSMLNDLYLVYTTYSNSNPQMLLRKVSGSPGAETINTVAFPTGSISYAGAPYNYENFGPQLGTTVKFNLYDDRPTSLAYVNGNLWFAQTIFLPQSNPTRSSLQWWQIDTTGNVLQLGLIDDPTGNLFYAYPSMAVNKNDDALIGYSVFSSQQYAGCGYSYHDHNLSTSSTDSGFVYKPGENIYADTASDGRNSWGYWSATVVDPTDNTGFWTLQAYATSTANYWGTWWANVDESVTGISNVAQSQATKVFPNPNNGIFNLVLDNPLQANVHFKLFDIFGRMINSDDYWFAGNGNLVSVNARALSPGIYLAEITIEGKLLMSKVIIQ